MAKYYKFKFSAGFAGTATENIIKFDDNVTEKEIEEIFNDWYEEQRRDYGSNNEISEEEAERLGVDEDYSE